jgi:hypothetical protein
MLYPFFKSRASALRNGHFPCGAWPGAPPSVETVADVAALLRARGTVLVDDGGGLLVALLGEYGYALYEDGRASNMLPARFADEHPEVATGNTVRSQTSFEGHPILSPRFILHGESLMKYTGGVCN